MITKTEKRILVGLLAIVLLFSQIPQWSFAQEMGVGEEKITGEDTQTVSGNDTQESPIATSATSDGSTGETSSVQEEGMKTQTETRPQEGWGQDEASSYLIRLSESVNASATINGASVALDVWPLTNQKRNDIWSLPAVYAWQSLFVQARVSDFERRFFDLRTPTGWDGTPVNVTFDLKENDLYSNYKGITPQTNVAVLHQKADGSWERLPVVSVGEGSVTATFTSFSPVIITQAARLAGDFAWDTLTDGTAEIVSYQGSDAVVAVPSAIEEKRVSSVGELAFGNNQTITSVSIPASVTALQYQSFDGCSALATIEIPDTLETMGGFNFRDTAWYENQQNGVVYAGNVLYSYKGDMAQGATIDIRNGTLGIAGYAFDGIGNLANQKLASVNIPLSVTNIQEAAFYNCLSMTSIHIPSTVKGIGRMAIGYMAKTQTRPWDGSVEIPNFTIYGMKGSAAERYATANGFTFVEKADPQGSNPADNNGGDQTPNPADNNGENKPPTPADNNNAGQVEGLTEQEANNIRNTDGTRARNATYNGRTVTFNITQSDIATLRAAQNELQALLANGTFAPGARLLKLFELNPNGNTRNFPNGIRVTLDVPGVHAGQNIAVLHGIRDANGNLRWERLTNVAVGNGSIAMTLTSFSPIAIIELSDSRGASNQSGSRTAPRTGQTGATAGMLCAALGTVAIPCAAMLRKRKRAEQA